MEETDIFDPRGDKKGTRWGQGGVLWMSRASLSFERPHAGAAQVLEVFFETCGRITMIELLLLRWNPLFPNSPGD